MTGMKAAFAAILALGGLPLALAAAQAPAPAPRALNLSRDERGAIAALQAAAAGADRAAQDAALAAARNVARGADAQYALAHYQFEIGGARGDAAMQTQAIDNLVNSGVAQAGELPALLANQAGRAFAAGDFERTDRLLARMIEAQPNNPVLLADYGQFKARRGQRAEAVAYLQRAIAAQEASGRAAPEGWHLRALALAFDGRMAPQGIAAARGLAAAYPTSVNWRDALLSYRELAPDPALDLDVRRLMRASQALAGERDYLETAEALDRAGLPGEAKAVLDEGISRNMLEAAKPVVAQAMTATVRRAAADRAALPRLRAQAQAAAVGAPARTAADAHFAFGQYGEAAELYRLALQQGGEDANLVNLRLGAALALAGRRPEAEAALRATTGPRADLAGFWLAWLARRPV
jgi:Tfp pilus assembly protein PilF